MITDSQKVVLALVICLFLAFIGVLIVRPWYGLRLVQWHSLRSRYAVLRRRDASGFAEQFQQAKVGLWKGFLYGAFFYLPVVAFVVILLVIAA